MLLHKNKLYILNIVEIKIIVMNELHKRLYSGHPRYQKIIIMIIKYFFCPNMKKEVEKYLARCLECQQVKAKHQHPTWFLQPLHISEWKWKTISIDFIIGLPNNFWHHYSIMVIVDKLSKDAHFIRAKSTYKDVNIANNFMKEIFRLHGVPKVIVSDRDAKFIGNF